MKELNRNNCLGGPKCPHCGGVGLTPGWSPTYQDPDNAGGHSEAEPCPMKIGRFAGTFKVKEEFSGEYVGPDKRLKGERAMVFTCKQRPRVVYAQFNTIPLVVGTLSLSHGWHKFPKHYFKLER